jgi:thioredoxin reductase (NADPH)
MTVSYYPLHFLRSEGVYYDRTPRSFLSRTARFGATVAFELLRNGMKWAANGLIWMANLNASKVKEGRVVVIGSGPAGYTAALYLARAGLKPLVLEGSMSGGQLMTTELVENFPGFPNGILGPRLMSDCAAQAKKWGAEMVEVDAAGIDFSRYPYTVKTANGNVRAKAIVIATGATAKRLDAPGMRDGEFWQRGVSACAVCDGPLPVFQNQPLFVIGGGDSALEEALFLSKFASKVSLVHRRGKLRASQALVERALKNPKIEILYNREVAEVRGAKSVEAVVLKTNAGKKEIRKARGVFIAIGHTPNTQFLKGQLETDALGYLRVERGSAKTSMPGVFACGDVQDPHYRQAITAAGTGCMAADDAFHFLNENP